MMRTMAGPERFRAGHRPLLRAPRRRRRRPARTSSRAIEDGAGLDLGQFRRWYEQAGTPKVEVAARARRRHRRRCTSSRTVPPTPGPARQAAGADPAARSRCSTATPGSTDGEQLVMLDASAGELQLSGLRRRRRCCRSTAASPRRSRSSATRRPRTCVFLAAHDDDPFARYEAMQQLVVQHLVAAVSGRLARRGRARRRAARRSATAFAAVLADSALDDLMRGELMILPGETYLAEQLLVADPGRDPRASARRSRAGSAPRSGPSWRALHDRVQRGALRPRRRGARARASSRPRRWSISPPARPSEASATAPRRSTTPPTT